MQKLKGNNKLSMCEGKRWWENWARAKHEGNEVKELAGGQIRGALNTKVRRFNFVQTWNQKPAHGFKHRSAMVQFIYLKYSFVAMWEWYLRDMRLKGRSGS